MRKLMMLAFSALFLLSLNAANPKKHYTVIVSLDGFRWDYPAMYRTPNLDRMAADGVKAVMLPSYPASTFPNHYTLATGLVPDHHGIINNTFGMQKTNGSIRWAIPPPVTIRNIT